MANNGYVSLDDFLAGITAKPVDLDVPGLGRVQVRGLTALEAQQLEQYRENDQDIMVQAVYRGLVNPKLSEAHVQALYDGSVAKIRVMWARIAQLTALGEAGDMEKKVGAGS